MMQTHLCVLCSFLLIVVTVYGQVNDCTKSKAKSCKECIANFGCAWCEDEKFAQNPNVLISRCNTPEELLAQKCRPSRILNPQSEIKNKTENKFSNVGESEVGSATQMKPQAIRVKLRPGDPVQIKFSYKQVEDYPVDLYYLLDLSKSMQDDLVLLRALGQQLGQSMQNITRDFRLGFGSFVDKTVTPYISTVPSKLKNPCSEKEPCVPPFSFHNDLPLTSNISSFVSSVDRVTHSGNLDFPEGGFDAMMQAIVCQTHINWRQKATHLLVYSTDATFHYAGDGKLGGIVFPNDGKCYLNGLGHYTKADEMDYPSIGHLVRKITEYKIQPVFAVTEDVITTYKNLKKMIPKSVVGNLTSDSSNIIGLIEDAYNDLKGQILIEVEAPKEMNISNKKSYCVGSTADGFNCDGVKLGDVVNFTFSLSTDKCLDQPVTIYLQPYGYDEKLSIIVDSQCNCECDDVGKTKADACSGNGEFQCGACVCDSGYVGLDCSCNPKNDDPEVVSEYLKNCTDPSSNEICNGRGECQCGTCVCLKKPNTIIDGKYCQCDNLNCPRVQGKLCNGQGTCDCGKCICNDQYTGDDCVCSLNTEKCIDRREGAIDSTAPCNGRGVCECEKCNCTNSQGSSKYRGEFCQTEILDCDVHQDCIQCKVFKTGKYNSTQLCDDNCRNYNMTELGKESVSNGQECVYTDYSDDCTFLAKVEDVNNNIQVEYNPEKICKTYVNPIFIILAIIAAIVGIGLAILLIWKLLTSIKDAREFKNFQKESQNPKWQGGENPIFKKATSTFRNPMYTGGKPTSNL